MIFRCKLYCLLLIGDRTVDVDDIFRVLEAKGEDSTQTTEPLWLRRVLVGY